MKRVSRTVNISKVRARRDVVKDKSVGGGQWRGEVDACGGERGVRVGGDAEGVGVGGEIEG